MRDPAVFEGIPVHGSASRFLTVDRRYDKTSLMFDIGLATFYLRTVSRSQSQPRIADDASHLLSLRVLRRVSAISLAPFRIP